MNSNNVQTMAAYNRWMNQRLYEVSAGLTDTERKKDRGAFFRSIHGTLNHLLVGDKIWLSRFMRTTFSVASLDEELFSNFDELTTDREKTDQAIDEWAASLRDSDLSGTLELTSIVNSTTTSLSMTLCVMHFFNHQTHHRGQLTTLLSQCGAEYGVTDLIWLQRD